MLQGLFLQPQGYETLVYDCMIGDKNVSMGTARVTDPPNSGRTTNRCRSKYPAGSAGPDTLLWRSGRRSARSPDRRACIFDEPPVARCLSSDASRRSRRRYQHVVRVDVMDGRFPNITIGPCMVRRATAKPVDPR